MSRNNDPFACGCCQGISTATPELVYNRPALTAIEYRIGRHATFLRSMIAEISRKPSLTNWRARDDRDYGIALLDLWAYVADILTFYQERIANEAFLRTATQRESLQRLAALIDYRLGPGAAATAYLAFLLDKGKSLELPIGLRVQSVPGQKEKPQKFETVEALAASADWNRLRVFPQPASFNPFASGNVSSPLLAASESASVRALPSPGDKTLLFDAWNLEEKQITGVTRDEPETSVLWTPPVQGSKFNPMTSRLAGVHRRFRVFGSAAATQFMEPESAPKAPGGIRWKLRKAGADYSFALPVNFLEIPLEARVQDLKAGSRVLLRRPAGGSEPAFSRVASVESLRDKPIKFGPLEDTVTHLRLAFALAATPAAARAGDNRLHFFGIGDDQAVWTLRQTSAGGSNWSHWESLGGRATEVAAAANAAGLLEVFARDLDGAIWRNHQLNQSTWSGWQSLGGQIDLLRVIRRPNGRLSVFGRGKDHSVRTIEQDPTGVWGAWSSLGGVIDCLAVEVNQSGRLEVFARGTNHALWRIRQKTANSQSWDSWGSLGGRIDLLSVARNADGRIEVFARGSDKAVWRNRQTAPDATTWTGWTSLGGWVDLLVAIPGEGGRLELFVRGLNQAVFHNRQQSANGTIWSGWNSLGGWIDRLAVGPDLAGLPQVFVRGADKALYRKARSGSGWTLWNFHGAPMWPVADRRLLTIAELDSQDLPLALERYPDTIIGSQVYLPLAATASLASHRRAILDDDRGLPQTVDIDSVGQTHGHWVVSFTPALTRALNTREAVLYGNVAEATHGETVRNEVLGSGDAALRFQHFRLRKSPVTHVPKPGAPNGVASTLEVRVGGILWHETKTLLGLSDSERAFVTSIDEEGRTTVQFGGSPGARLPSGRNNVTAVYRQGLGPAGNVPALSVTTLLDRPAGLKSVSNPAAAQGGSSPESESKARANAPGSVRTFGRIVSLRDFEDAARESAVVAKAGAVWEWRGDEMAAVVTVAGQGGARITDALRITVATDLDSRRDTNRPMSVRSHDNLPLQIRATLQVDSDRLLDDVDLAARQTLLDHFSFERRALGQPVFLSEVFRVLQQVEGVIAVDVDRLRLKTGSNPLLNPTLPIPASGIATLASPDLQLKTQFNSL